jgi:release factor glutamine methyltransferase
MVAELARTRRALLAEAAALLGAAGLDQPRREAVRAWNDLAGGTLRSAMLDPAAAVADELAASYLAAVGRRAAGEPLAHATGWTGFRQLTLRTDQRALIPRPETEGVVDLVLTRVRTGRVADIGTGSGCIALSLAAEAGFDRVLGVDLSRAALALATENRALVEGRIELVRGDLCTALASASLDALVSNPPYLTSGEYAALDRSVKLWEPELALAAGPDGLEAIRRLLDDGRRVVRPGGWLVLEVDAARAGRCARQAAASGWTDVAIEADLFGRERYLLARRSDAE